MGAPKLVAKTEIKITICPFFFRFSFLLEQKYSRLLLQTLGGLYGKLPVGRTVSRDQRSREHPLAKFTVTVASNQPCLSLPAAVFGKAAQVKHGTVPSLLQFTRNLPSGHAESLTVRTPSSRFLLEPGSGLPRLRAQRANALLLLQRCCRPRAGEEEPPAAPGRGCSARPPSSQPRRSSRSHPRPRPGPARRSRGIQGAARASAGRSPQPPQPLGPACSRERGRLRRLCAHPPPLYFFLRK